MAKRQQQDEEHRLWHGKERATKHTDLDKQQNMDLDKAWHEQ